MTDCLNDAVMDDVEYTNEQIVNHLQPDTSTGWCPTFLFPQEPQPLYRATQEYAGAEARLEEA